jgi:hypothetical protein
MFGWYLAKQVAKVLDHFMRIQNKYFIDFFLVDKLAYLPLKSNAVS